MTQSEPYHLVLMPGLDGTGTLFRRFIASLPNPNDVTVVTYGKETSHGKLLNLVLSAIPLKRNFLLIAESFSGPLAIELAARHLAGLCGLVLCASFARSPVGKIGKIGFWLAKPLLSATPFPKLAARLLFVGRGQEELLCELVRAVGSIPRKIILDRLWFVLNCDTTDYLSAVKIPILCIQAGADRLVRKCAALHIQESNMLVELATVEGPHLLLQTRPGLVLDQIRQFEANISSKR